MAHLIQRVSILGTGLIGGSFALALRKYTPDIHIVGWDRDDWDIDEATRRLSEQPDRPLVAALLDQRCVAGFGNLWVNELCFLRGHNPWTPVGSVDITMYRDDLRMHPARALGHTELPADGIEGKTVVLVTHNLEEAVFLGDRLVLLDQGRVIADLPRDEFLASARPEVQAYVRAFDQGRPNSPARIH